MCSGVEIKNKNIPNGCGCKPSSTAPCHFQNLFDDPCNTCSTQDLVDDNCPECIECLEECDTCIGEIPSNSIDDYKTCLNRMNKSCRLGCDLACKKNG